MSTTVYTVPACLPSDVLDTLGAADIRPGDDIVVKDGDAPMQCRDIGAWIYPYLGSMQVLCVEHEEGVPASATRRGHLAALK